MRKSIGIAMVVALTSVLALSACGGEPETTATEPTVTAPVARTEPAPIPSREPIALATTTTPVVVEAPEPTRAPLPEARADVRVRRLVITRGIEDREPIDEIDVLDRGEELERVYAFVDAANAGDADGTLEVTFEREDGFVTGMVELEVPSRAPRHRTWAFSRGVRSAGAWRAIVRDGSGRVLAEQRFTVE